MYTTQEKTQGTIDYMMALGGVPQNCLIASYCLFFRHCYSHPTYAAQRCTSNMAECITAPPGILSNCKLFTPD